MKKKQVLRHVSFSEASETWGHIGWVLAVESTAIALHPDLCFSHSYSSRVHSETVCAMEHSVSSLSERVVQSQVVLSLKVTAVWNLPAAVRNETCPTSLALNLPVQFPFIWGKGEIFNLLVLPFFLAHLIFHLILLISFSLKWENVSRVTFVTFLVHQFLIMLCSFLHFMKVAGPFLCSYLAYI